MVKVLATKQGIVVCLGMKHSCVHRYLKKRLSKRCKKIRECPSATSLNQIQMTKISDSALPVIDTVIDNYSSFKSLVGILPLYTVHCTM